MSWLLSAVLQSRQTVIVAAVHARERASLGRWVSPGVGLREWLYRIGRPASASTRAEEGRGIKYPTRGR